MSRINNNLVIFLMFLVLGIVAYQNALSGPFIYDDHFFIEHNENITTLSPGMILKFFVQPAETVASIKWDDIYRPLRTLSFAVDYFFWKLDPFGYHLTNILFHIVNAFLLMLFLKKLFKNTDTAVFASLIFLVHPLQTEAVTWISSRGDVLFLFFYLIGLLFYVKHIDLLRSGREDLSYFLISIGAYIFALLSKEMAITFPLIIFIYEILFLYEKKGLREIAASLKRGIPFYIISFSYCLLRYMLLDRVSQRSWWGGSALNNFLSIPRAFFVYFKLLFLPFGQSLEHMLLPASSIKEPFTFLALIGLAVLLIFTVYLFIRRQYILTFGVLWFFVTCLPVANLVPINTLVSERFMYLPIIGFSIIISYSLEKLAFSFRFSRMPAFLILFFFVFITIMRNYDWQDEERLWHSVVKASPESYKAYYCLGNVYERQGRDMEAIKSYQKSLALKPDYPAVHFKLGSLYQKLGILDKALIYYRNVLVINAASPITCYNLGIVYGSLGNYEKAKEYFEKALSMEPDNGQAHYNLAVTLKAIDGNNEAEIKRQINAAAACGYKGSPEAQRYLLMQGNDKGGSDE